MPNFANDPIDHDYLIDSGLLFEINRQFLHPLGIAMSVQVDDKGKKTWSFKDCREQPEQLVFDKNLVASGRMKYEHFMRTFGFAQMARRCKKLGQSTQFVGQWTKHD